MTRATPADRAGRDVAIGIAGAGRIAEHIHFRVLAGLANVRVTAIAEPSAVRAAIAARHFPRAEIMPDVNTMLAKCVIDALVVCSPPATHADAARAALEAGTHVYVEKPVAVTSHDARELVALAQTSGRVAMAGFNYRRHPLIERLRLELRSGRIGRPVMMRSVFSVAHSTAAGWQSSPATGGGALLELGSHHFDLARFLFDDEVADIAARVWARHLEGDTASVDFRMTGGVHGTSVFAIGAADDDRIEILGERGIARLDRMRGELVYGAPGFEYGRRHTLVRELHAMGGALQRMVGPLAEPSYERALVAFIDAVRTGEAVRPDLVDGLRSLEWIEAAVLSATSHASVSLDAPASTSDARASTSDPC
jgi:predicted dehydrogenase